MLSTRADQDSIRWRFERRLLARYFSDFPVHEYGRERYITGWMTPNGSSMSHELRLDVPPHFPHQKPRLFVTSPITLWTYGKRSRINDMGVSHACHVLGTGHGGCCEICHVDDWDASISLTKVLLMGTLWLEAYAMHLRCGDDIDTCLRRLKKKIRRH